MNAPRKAQFDFKRAGKILLFLALLSGLFLSRHAASCWIANVAGYDIGGVTDDGSNSGLIDDKGTVRRGTQGEYDEVVREHSGFWSNLVTYSQSCIQENTFSHPRELYYAFLAFLALGIAFLLIDRITGGGGWENDIRERGKAAPPLPQRRSSTPKAAPIDVHFEHDASASEPMPILRNMADPSTLPAQNLPSSDIAPKPFAPTTHTPPKRVTNTPKPDTVNPLEKRPELRSLGFGSVEDLSADGWLSQDAHDPAAPQNTNPNPPARISALPAGVQPPEHSDDFEEPKSGMWFVGFNKDNENFSSSAVPAIQRPNPFQDQLPPPPSSRPTPPRSRPKKRDGLSLQPITPKQSRPTWKPEHWNGPTFYVAPNNAAPPRANAGESPSNPIFGIKNALQFISKNQKSNENIQVRLLPGIYREQLSLPPRVALVNHKLPANLSDEELWEWLSADDPHSEVVIAPPNLSPLPQALIRLDQAHGVFFAGLRILGNDHFAHGGIHAHKTQSAKFYACSISGHLSKTRGAGIHMDLCGSRKHRRAIVFERCLFQDNNAQGHGGALFIDRSIAVLRSCLLRENLSKSAGGAIFLHQPIVPTLIEDCIIQGNTVSTEEALPDASRRGWSGVTGHGGGIYAWKGGVHLKTTSLLGNQAQGSGGGLFGFASRILIEGNPEGAASGQWRIAENRAMRGGGVLISGLKPSEDQDAMAALKVAGVVIEYNQAQESGGGIASFRMASVSIKRCRIEHNNVLSSQGEGGGVHATLGSKVKINTTSISYNNAPSRGAGLSVCNASLRVFDGCQITNNTSKQGEFAGVAFYTTFSRIMEDLRSSEKLEWPVICALSPCAITHNQSKRGVAGLFIGCLEDEASIPIVYAIKDPKQITHNTVASVAALRQEGNVRKKRPENLMILWQRRMVANDGRLPQGKHLLNASPTKRPPAPPA